MADTIFLKIGTKGGGSDGTAACFVIVTGLLKKMSGGGSDEIDGAGDGIEM